MFSVKSDIFYKRKFLISNVKLGFCVLLYVSVFVVICRFNVIKENDFFCENYFGKNGSIGNCRVYGG